MKTKTYSRRYHSYLSKLCNWKKNNRLISSINITITRLSNKIILLLNNDHVIYAVCNSKATYQYIKITAKCSLNSVYRVIKILKYLSGWSVISAGHINIYERSFFTTKHRTYICITVFSFQNMLYLSPSFQHKDIF